MRREPKTTDAVRGQFYPIEKRKVDQTAPDYNYSYAISEKSIFSINKFFAGQLCHKRRSKMPAIIEPRYHPLISVCYAKYFCKVDLSKTSILSFEWINIRQEIRDLND